MKLRYAMVCASNQNRSMEAHALLQKRGFNVSSYGTGQHVKLPGPSISEPNIYEFGTPYRIMFEDLKRKNPELNWLDSVVGELDWEAPFFLELKGQGIALTMNAMNRGGVQEMHNRYKKNGLLQMLRRNLSVKEAPQRWQENAADGVFDVIFTFEGRVLDMVVEDLQSRDLRLMKSVLVVNIDVKDNAEGAAIGARLALEFCRLLETVDTWEDEIDTIIQRFEKQHKRRAIYSICFY